MERTRSFQIGSLKVHVAPFGGALAGLASGMVFWHGGRALIAYAEPAPARPGRSADAVADALRRAVRQARAA